MTFTEELLYPYHIFPEGVVEKERGDQRWRSYSTTTYYYPLPASSISKVGRRRRRNKEALKARNWTVIEKKFQKALKESVVGERVALPVKVALAVIVIRAKTV